MEGIMKRAYLLLLLFILPAAHAYEFKVLSWNVFMLPKPLKDSLQKTRTKVIPEQLKNTDYDMIFMQEAFTSDFRGAVRSALKKTHPHTFYLGNPYRRFTVFGSGLYVVSKFPVKILGYSYYKNCSGADCFAAKGAALMEITLPGGQKVHVMNTHLQASNRHGSIRMKQLAQIHTLLVRHGQPDIPQFLVGDLNIDDDEPEFQLGLALLGMDYARLTGPIMHTTGRANPCYKAGASSDWVDHMWYDNYHGIDASTMRVKNFEFERNGKVCPSSDHHAIEAAFRF